MYHFSLKDFNTYLFIVCVCMCVCGVGGDTVLFDSGRFNSLFWLRLCRLFHSHRLFEILSNCVWSLKSPFDKTHPVTKTCLFSN